MRRIDALTLLLATSVLSAAPVPKELKNSDKIQGTWKVESLVNFGKPSTENLYWTIDAEGNLSRHPDPDNPANNMPRLVVLKQDRETKSLDYVSGQTTYLGLYRLQGDTLEFCLARQGAERPTAIEATPNNYFWTLKRVKPEEKK